MVNGEAGKGDRYRPVPKDYGEKFDRIFRPSRWERFKRWLRKIFEKIIAK